MARRRREILRKPPFIRKPPPPYLSKSCSKGGFLNNNCPDPGVVGAWSNEFNNVMWKKSLAGGMPWKKRAMKEVEIQWETHKQSTLVFYVKVALNNTNISCETKKGLHQNRKTLLMWWRLRKTELLVVCVIRMICTGVNTFWSLVQPLSEQSLKISIFVIFTDSILPIQYWRGSRGRPKSIRS